VSGLVVLLVLGVPGLLILWGRHRSHRAIRIQQKGIQGGQGRPLDGPHWPRYPK
jgi:hypothetical protein